MTIILRQAMQHEAKDLLQLVGKAGLQSEGIKESIENYLVVVNDEGETIGTVGLERIGKDGLLRSFVLKQKYSSETLLLKLIDKILVYSKDKGVETLYLLTKAVHMFEALSFKVVPKGKVPPHIESADHVKNNAASGAELLAYALDS
jgi:amino-acid N-acetyltransferase